MNSCVYECQILHERFSPRRHRFLYRIFLFAFDLDELGFLHRQLPLFSVDRANVYAFRDRDFLPTNSKPHNPAPGSQEHPVAPDCDSSTLKQRVLRFLSDRNIALTDGKVILVTLPRVFGYLFNPVSFYFCFDRDGKPVAAIVEVTNTFKEIKPYLLRANEQADANSTNGAFRLRVPKHFYVSPYSDVDVAFDFALRLPGKKLSVQIDDYAGTQRTLTSVLSGTQRELTSARLAWYTLKYPFITLQVIGRIHWHALRLWLKRVPWFAKTARATDQRELYRPHGSLLPAENFDST